MIFYFYKYSGNAIFLINSSCKFDQASDDVKKFVILIGGDRCVFFTCAHTSHTRYVVCFWLLLKIFVFLFFCEEKKVLITYNYVVRLLKIFYVWLRRGLSTAAGGVGSRRRPPSWKNWRRKRQEAKQKLSPPTTTSHVKTE